MRPPRFTADLIAAVQAADPGACYHPPSRPGTADDFLQLSDGTALPNPTRAAAWIRAQPAPAPTRRRPGRPHLTLITGGSQPEEEEEEEASR
jgi:hypothetical protein